MEPVECQLCGQVSVPAVDGSPPLTWAMDRDRDRVRWTCPRCTSENVRAMEAKLEPDWW
jgi:hypothetical protein